MRDLNTFRAYDAPDVDLKNTGKILKLLRLENHLTVRELQDFFGFDYPNAIYDWEKGLKLPNMSNLIALSTLYEVPIDKILLSNEQDSDCRQTGLKSESEAQFFIYKKIMLITQKISLL